MQIPRHEWMTPKVKRSLFLYLLDVHVNKLSANYGYFWVCKLCAQNTSKLWSVCCHSSPSTKFPQSVGTVSFRYLADHRGWMYYRRRSFQMLLSSSAASDIQCPASWWRWVLASRYDVGVDSEEMNLCILWMRKTNAASEVKSKVTFVG